MGVLVHWGNLETPYEVIGVFADTQTAYKMTFSAEFRHNTRSGPIKRQYIQLFLASLKADFKFTEAFHDVWTKEARVGLEAEGSILEIPEGAEIKAIIEESLKYGFL